MSILGLAAAGRFGELRFGASIADIVRAFGEPDDRLASDPSALIKYGDFELIFIDGVLTAVHCEFGSPRCPQRRTGLAWGSIRPTSHGRSASTRWMPWQVAPD